MKKSITFLFILVMLMIGGYFFFDRMDFSQPAMDFPEELDTNGCLGLNYHRVRKERLVYKITSFVTNSEELKMYNVYQHQFANQMQQLKEKGAVFLTPNEISEAQRTNSFPKKCVWISFDDIDRTVYENAFPILKEVNIPFTVFVIAGQVGHEFSNLKLATWEELQEMVDSGLVTVGSHTYDMHFLDGEEPIFFQKEKFHDFKKDLIKSKTTLEEKLSVHVTDFAYPFGNGRTDLAQVIQESGFERAYILAPRTITSNNDKYWMNRILVNQKVFDDVVQQWIE